MTQTLQVSQNDIKPVFVTPPLSQYVNFATQLLSQPSLDAYSPITSDSSLILTPTPTRIRQRDDDTEPIDPILTECGNRFVLFPIKYHDIWQMCKQQESSVWTVSDIDLERDSVDWLNLNNNERHFIKYVLAFFAASDGIVVENLAARFMNDVKIPEARHFYSFLMAMENVHSETYSTLLDTYIKDPVEKNTLFNAVNNFPIIKQKAEWAQRWIVKRDDNSSSRTAGESFAKRLIAFACVEGIFFSGSFCAIFWLKKRGLMPGLTFSNEYISRDEGMHCDFASLLYSKLTYKLKPSEICMIVGQAVAIEKKFVSEALPVSLIGMNANLMCLYIEFVANRLVVSLGCQPMYHQIINQLVSDRIRRVITPVTKKEFLTQDDEPDTIEVNLGRTFKESDPDVLFTICDHGDRTVRFRNGSSFVYNQIQGDPVKNPFDFMEMISLQGKTNMFEKKIGDYQKAGVMSGEKHTFSLDEEF